jgi:zona occludens toxin
MEEKVDDRGNILKSPLFRIGIPLAILIACFAVYRVVSYFTVPEQQETIETEHRTVPKAVDRGQYVQAMNPQSRFELQADWLPVSEAWRIVGKINDIFLVWGEHGTREIHSRNCAKMIKTGEDYCVINNQLVTYYSFRSPEQEKEERFDFDFGVSDSNL